MCRSILFSLVPCMVGCVLGGDASSTGNADPGGDDLASCSDPCIAGATQCNGTGVATCEIDAGGCLHWGAAAACSGADTCGLGFCGPHGIWAGRTAMPTPRVDFGLAAAPDRLYAMGGTNSYGAYALYPQVSVEAYSFATGTWAPLHALPAPRVRLASALAGDGRVYAIGGHNSLNDVAYCPTAGEPYCTHYTDWQPTLAYSPATNTWAPVADMPTPRRYLAAATAPDGRIFAIGGETGIYLETISTVEAYTAATNTWQRVASMPTARGRLAAVTGVDGRIYVLGGYNGRFSTKFPTGLTTVEAYDPATNTWQTLASMPTGRLDFAAAIGVDGRIYVMGGTKVGGLTASALATVDAYNPATNTWEVATSMPSTRMGHAGAAGPGALIYAIGGERQLAKELADVETYMP